MSKAYEPGQKVEWDWGQGTASGTVAEVHKDDVQKTIKDTSVKREADSDNPAYTIEQEDGSRVLKSHNELRKKS